MRCYNHPDIDAHGTCKICSRGICAQCSVDLGHSLSCKGSHEQLAQDVHLLTLRSVNVQATAKRSLYVGPAFFGIIGLIIFGDGLRRDQSLMSSGVLFGGAFIAFGIVTLVLNMRAYGRAKD